MVSAPTVSRVDAHDEHAGPVSPLDGASGLACAEVKGGIQPAHDVIELPGLRGVLYSIPCEAPRGGDVHYLSVCGSRLLSWVCVDVVDERPVFRALDRRLDRIGAPALTTAVLATYFPPSRRLSIRYAGHPEAWLYTHAERRWMPSEAEPAARKATAPVGLPFGTGLSPSFTRRRIEVETGDRVLLLTDGVLEATSPDGVEFTRDRLEQVLRAHAGGCGELVDELLAALRAHTGRERLVDDHVTIMVAEFVEGPRGPALWHLLQNRLRPGRVEVAAIRRRQDRAAGLATPENARRGEQAPATASRGGAMRAVCVTLAAILAVGTLAHAQQAPNLVSEVRAAIARQDFAEGERLIAAHRASSGETPIMMEALSWLGRGALAAGALDKADAYAQQTYGLATAALKARRVDDDPRLATALGASIEVMAQAGAKRGARSEVVAFLRTELERWNGTSVTKRIQKNLNLLSLEGVPAPALDLGEHLGPAPPALSALKGRVVLLFFWAHWCGDCKTQAPVLARLLERYGSQGLMIVAPTQRYGYVAGGKKASAEDEKAYIDQVRQTVYAQLASAPVPLAQANMERYGVSTTPTLVLVDRDGFVRLYNPGRMTEEALDPIVRRMLD